ncbi:unnamed protein product [Cuscuta epithymum]|uniref:RanBP2-type domain-containing protein n=1 Tax=Cuscuta epithymum TaxID=186058 RepID=A0AAV0CHX6_9ASTE|nr:unnamed protein product [Cuscuta epithymum]
MAVTVLLRRIFPQNPKPFISLSLQRRPFLSSAPSTNAPPEPSSLSARMRFVFDQIDAIQEERVEKDQTLQRIRAWRESKKSSLPQPQAQPQTETQGSAPNEWTEMGPEKEKCSAAGQGGLMAKKVELVHPWPEWIELMERLVQQNYFDHMRKDEDRMIVDSGFSVSAVAEQEGLDFTRDWKTVETAVLNFGRDRFDVLRALPRQDIQILVGYGCPSADKRLVFSAKLLRKHVHLDEGDVCSSCSLRSTCEKAYLLTNKEDEARTIDVMRVLLAYAFDPVNGSVANKSLLKMKAVKSVIRKLLHDVVKISAVPIDPNLPPPIIKKPPPKVKQPPPTPKKRVGRDDVEMKKGDWLCPKCDFMNFAKNTVCLQCDAKRPKRQLLPGEWECPQCNFLNYRRNVACFHCECKRPADDYTGSQLKERQNNRRMDLDEKMPNRVARHNVSNAWNFNFDDDESDGADVAAFEYADSHKLDVDFPLDKQAHNAVSKPPREYETDYSSPQQPGLGFNDFDDEEDDVDSYEVDTQNAMHKSSQINYSDFEDNSEDEDLGANDNNMLGRHHKNSIYGRKSKSMPDKVTLPSSEDSDIDFDSDNERPIHKNWNHGHLSSSKQRTFTRHSSSLESDDSDDDMRSRHKKGMKANREFGGRGSSNNKYEHSSDTERSKQRTFTRHSSSLESDDSDDDIRSRHKKGIKSNREFGGRGSSNNKYEHSSDIETDDDDLNYRRSRQRGQRGSSSFADCRDRASKTQNYFADDSNRRSREFHRNGKSIRDNKDWSRTDSRGGESTKNLRSGRGGFSNSGPRTNNYGNQPDSYLNSERYKRPRVNVR